MNIDNNIFKCVYAYVFVIDIQRRDEQIKSLLELGRCVFIYTPAPIICFAEQQSRVNLLDYFTFAELKTTEAIGKNIEFKGEIFFSPLWVANDQNFEYRAFFQEPIGKPLFFIKDTQHIIGTHIKVKKGHIVFLPYSQSPNQRLFNSIVDLIKDLKQKNAGKIEMPLWSKRYYLPDEKSHQRDLLKLEEELNSLQQKISQKKYEIETIEKQKILFVGTGTPLELEIKKIFEELGFTAEDTRPGRDDLILKYENRVAVVEIKGIKNSSAERHAAQLEKWVNEYYENNDTKPKGILIVNTYNDKPLEKRTEPSFPDQMRPYSVAREHCLMTALQLLGLFLDCRNNENKKKEMIDLIFSTKGIFTEYQNWQDFISQEDEAIQT